MGGWLAGWLGEREKEKERKRERKQEIEREPIKLVLYNFIFRSHRIFRNILPTTCILNTDNLLHKSVRAFGFSLFTLFIEHKCCLRLSVSEQDNTDVIYQALEMKEADKARKK